jgi:hypothetical protein
MDGARRAPIDQVEVVKKVRTKVNIRNGASTDKVGEDKRGN